MKTFLFLKTFVCNKEITKTNNKPDSIQTGKNHVLWHCKKQNERTLSALKTRCYIPYHPPYICSQFESYVAPNEDYLIPRSVRGSQVKPSRLTSFIHENTKIPLFVQKRF